MITMQRIEVDVQTGEVQVIELTPEEVAAAQAQNDAWVAQQNAMPPAMDLQAQIVALTAELNAIKSKVGA